VEAGEAGAKVEKKVRLEEGEVKAKVIGEWMIDEDKKADEDDEG
jgi:hypothetical protein